MHQSYCMRYTVVSGVVLASAFRARSQPVDQLISFRFQKKKKCSEKKIETILSALSRPNVELRARPFCRLGRRLDIRNRTTCQ